MMLACVAVHPKSSSSALTRIYRQVLPRGALFCSDILPPSSQQMIQMARASRTALHRLRERPAQPVVYFERRSKVRLGHLGIRHNCDQNETILKSIEACVSRRNHSWSSSKYVPRFPGRHLLPETASWRVPGVVRHEMVGVIGQDTYCIPNEALDVRRQGSYRVDRPQRRLVQELRRSEMSGVT